MRTLKNPDLIDKNITYVIIEAEEGCEKLSSDFRYMFEDRIKMGNTIKPKEMFESTVSGAETDTFGHAETAGAKGTERRFVCCTYDCDSAEKKLSAHGLVYGKDYFFAEDFFCLLDDWKNKRIAYAAYTGTLKDRLQAISFGYAAKHGLVLPEDPHRDILTEKHLPRNTKTVVQRFYHVLYLIPGLMEALPQLLARKDGYKKYDHICFYSIPDAIRFKNDHPDVADKVITVEELKAHTMASLYMNAVYRDKRASDCVCDIPFETLWVGKDGTTRLCDCPDYLDISCGNIGVTDVSDVWNSPLAKIIRLSVINYSYTFCSRTQCGKLADAAKQKAVPTHREVSAVDHPKTINVANDYVCNLHCLSCRKCIYAVNDEREQTAVDACTDALLSSGLLDAADKLLVGGGGEAFLSANYKKIICDGDVKRKNIIIMTNGTLFTPKEWEKLEGKYESIGFMVSVDATTKETYEKVRCGGNFDSLMQNMDFLSKLRRENKVQSVKVIMIVQKANYEEIPAFIRWAKDMGFDGVSLSHIRNWGTYEDDHFRMEVTMFDENRKMKPELATVMSDPVCSDAIVSTSWVR